MSSLTLATTSSSLNTGRSPRSRLESLTAGLTTSLNRAKAGSCDALAGSLKGSGRDRVGLRGASNSLPCPGGGRGESGESASVANRAATPSRWTATERNWDEHLEQTVRDAYIAIGTELGEGDEGDVAKC